ncbi:MAG: SusD/RagB family nutrient-binding outer membrane lipoprotein [Bacteroidales bacterium]|nr:SusD/RagB family nutrient-binding outer membrane lipoprotein [Bacteroidales bacterium]
MKKILLSLMCIALLLGTTSCKDWLDVNTDPDSPSAETATVDVRLPWIQYYYMYAWGNACFRTNLTTQMFAMASRTATNSLLMEWDYAQGHSTTAYQNWFIGAACNIPYLYDAADKEGASHYKAAALIIEAMGSVLMVDLFGEMPHAEACDGATLAPSYDDGDVIYATCLLYLDEAISLLSSPQDATATPLAKGDCWFGGDANKWKMLAHLMKARMYMTMSKLDDSYIQNAIDCINASGMKSHSDDLIATFANVESANTCFTVGDAYGPCTIWDSAAWGTGQRMNRWYVNLLTNFKEKADPTKPDPRAEKLLPSAMYHVDLNEAGNQIVSYEWLLDEGIDCYAADGGQKAARHVLGNCNATLTPAVSQSDAARIRTYPNSSIANSYNSVDDFVAGVKKYYREGKDVKITVNPDNVQIEYLPGAMMVVDNEPLYVEDIKYVQLAGDGLFECGGLAANDVNCYRSGSNATTRSLGYVQGTGSFYTRPDSDGDIFTYAEACFIKAEAYFLKGNKGEALKAYRDGIQAHFDRMNVKLNEWKGKGSCTTARGFDVSFAYGPMDAQAISDYMGSNAVCQNEGELTLSDIMMQKFIAMGPNYQNWNDMRKYDYYDKGVYTEMQEPAYRPGTTSTIGTGRSFFPRRWMHSTHETNYNNAHCYESYAKYSTIQGATDKSIPYVPVFWDAEAPKL